MTTPIIVDQLGWGIDEWRAVAGTLGAQAAHLMRVIAACPDDTRGTRTMERRELRGLECVSRRFTNEAYERMVVSLAIDAAHAADMAEHEAERMAGFLAGKSGLVSEWTPRK
jgi:hypothetical protein